MATGPYTNSINFRLNRKKPLNYTDLDNNFRFPNQWGENQLYREGMMVVSYDFGFTASDAISMYLASSDHTSTMLNAPGLTGSQWTAIAIPSAGYIGPTGVQGFQGAQGAGSQGFQGPIGPQGNTGAQGFTGIQGIQGFQGHTGYQGSVGSQGFTGLQGLQGFQGVQGTTGSQGFTGFQGLKGDQGFQGFQGSGVQGDQGFQGSTGLNGISGTSGVQGFQGPIGVQGFQGSGVQGAKGDQGFQGPTGLNGISGTSGVQGPQGPPILGTGNIIEERWDFSNTSGSALTNTTNTPTNRASLVLDLGSTSGKWTKAGCTGPVITYRIIGYNSAGATAAVFDLFNRTTSTQIAGSELTITSTSTTNFQEITIPTANFPSTSQYVSVRHRNGGSGTSNLLGGELLATWTVL